MIVYPEVLYDKYPQIESEIIQPFFAESHQIYTSHRDGVPSVTNLKTFEDLISNINEFDEIYKKVYNFISEADKKPILLHCTAGADRTGLMSFSLL